MSKFIQKIFFPLSLMFNRSSGFL